jgi:hypothetical protein
MFFYQFVIDAGPIETAINKNERIIYPPDVGMPPADGFVFYRTKGNVAAWMAADTDTI